MNAIAYARVSTEEQVREGVSLAAQSERLAAYCVARDWCLVGEERDEGISGKTIERPGLERVLAAVNAGAVDVVLVYSLDRLTRTVGDMAGLFDLFARRNVALVSVSESFDVTTATGRMFANFTAVLSQWEREVIAERTRAALAHKKKHLQAYASTPFGYDRAGNELIANAGEQQVVETIQTLRGRGSSLHGIARHLNRKGIPTKMGKQWQAATVRYILKNDLYQRGTELCAT